MGICSCNNPRQEPGKVLEKDLSSMMENQIIRDSFHIDDGLYKNRDFVIKGVNQIKKVNAAQYFTQRNCDIYKTTLNDEKVLSILSTLTAFDWNKQDQEQDPQREFRSIYKYVDDSLYEGEWIGNKKDGRGVYKYNNGSRYDGFWLRDQNHGYGRLVGVNGFVYEGFWQNDMRHGYGKMIKSDESHYEGDFFENKKQGEGTQTWPDGRVYSGEWYKNHIHGQGIYIWEDGKRYEGYYKNSKKHGPGTFYWPDGRIYHGSWDEGKLIQGKYISRGKFDRLTASASLSREDCEKYIQKEREFQKQETVKQTLFEVVTQKYQGQENYKNETLSIRQATEGPNNDDQLIPLSNVLKDQKVQALAMKDKDIEGAFNMSGIDIKEVNNEKYVVPSKAIVLGNTVKSGRPSVVTKAVPSDSSKKGHDEPSLNNNKSQKPGLSMGLQLDMSKVKSNKY